MSQNKLFNRFVPGGSLLQDHNTFEPVIPADLAKRESANDDGTANCEMCRAAFPLASLDITQYGYRCAPCQKQAAQALVPPPDLDNVKVGRGRWWIMPIVIAVGSALTIMYPAAVLIVVVGVAGLAFRVMMRRGI